MPASPLIVTKLTPADSAGALEKEMMRTAHVYKNDVDLQRSHLNTNHVAEGGMEAAIERRISELHLARKPRKDAVRAVGIIVSCGDLEMSLDDAQAYLLAANEWLDQRYGAANTVAWSIHLDEGTPHLHRWQVPAIAAQEPGGYDRLSAKELFGPSSLKELQRDFYAGVAASWGFDPPMTKEMRQESGIRYADFRTLKRATETARVEEEYEAAQLRLEAARRCEAAARNPLKITSEVASLYVEARAAEKAAEALTGEVARLSEQCRASARRESALKADVRGLRRACRDAGGVIERVLAAAGELRLRCSTAWRDSTLGRAVLDILDSHRCNYELGTVNGYVPGGIELRAVDGQLQRLLEAVRQQRGRQQQHDIQRQRSTQAR